ncbi:MAG: hypothetical protein RSB96_03040, partial [Oscillospiraceae bacterium]
MDTSITKLKKEMIDLLSIHLDNVSVIGIFPSQIRENPIQKPIVGVGIESVALSSSCMDNYYGQDATSLLPIYGKLADITLFLHICTPTHQNNLAHFIFEEITSFLIFQNKIFDTKKI